MRFIRIASFCIAALVAGATAWIVGGNALAAKREREVSLAFEGTFGPRAALAAKYVLAAANADAKKAEDLSRAATYSETAAMRPSRRRHSPSRLCFRRDAPLYRRSRTRSPQDPCRDGLLILGRTSGNTSSRTCSGTCRSSVF